MDLGKFVQPPEEDFEDLANESRDEPGPEVYETRKQRREPIRVPAAELEFLRFNLRKQMECDEGLEKLEQQIQKLQGLKEHTLAAREKVISTTSVYITYLFEKYRVPVDSNINPETGEITPP